MITHSLGDIARTIDGELTGGDPDKRISGPAPFETVGADQITFAAQAKFLRQIEDTPAGAIIVPAGTPPSTKALIRVRNPVAAFAKVVGMFHTPERQTPGIDPRACIGERFEAGADVSIGPNVVVSDDVRVGERVTLHPGVFLGRAVTIGDDVEIHANVTILARCRIGSRVVVQAGSVIGSDGFGYAPDGDLYVKIPHTGIVVIEDDVEIGANNTIDRATMGETRIKQGVKTDNLVHVAHNVTVGENTVLVAQVGIAGSATIGRHVVLAGQAGVSGHLTLGDNVIVGPQAGIAQSVASGEVVSGSPEMPHKKWLRVQRTLPELPELKRRIASLEKQLKVRSENK